jgi:hypothetical protein
VESHAKTWHELLLAEMKELDVKGEEKKAVL